MTYLAEFASVSDFNELSELFQDDDRLAEAAVRPDADPETVCLLLSARKDDDLIGWPCRQIYTLPSHSGQWFSHPSDDMQVYLLLLQPCVSGSWVV